MFQLPDLAGDQAQELVEGGLHGRHGDEGLLVQLRRADLAELVQAGDRGAQLRPTARGQAQRQRLLDLGIPCDHASVDGIGLFQPAHALGELARYARVEDSNRLILPGKLREGLLFIAAGGFHGDPVEPGDMAEGGQRGDAVGVLEKEAAAPSRPIHASREDEEISTPRMICDTVTCLVCATVRSYVTWAAVPELSVGE